MTPKRFMLFSALFLIFSFNSSVPLVAGEASYNYITPTDLKARIQSGESLTILDIQVAEEFSLHHIKGAVATYAYPVKTDEEKGRIDSVYASFVKGFDPVVIVCPRGGGGAKRTFDYLVSSGLVANRLLILKNGQTGWPYPELLE